MMRHFCGNKNFTIHFTFIGRGSECLTKFCRLIVEALFTLFLLLYLRSNKSSKQVKNFNYKEIVSCFTRGCSRSSEVARDACLASISDHFKTLCQTGDQQTQLSKRFKVSEVKSHISQNFRSTFKFTRL